MKRRTYTAATLRSELDQYEARFGMSSEDHLHRRYNRYTVNEIPGMTGFDSHVWAAIYDEWRRLSGAIREQAS